MLAKACDAIRRASPGSGGVGTEEVADLGVRELGEIPVDHCAALLGRQGVQSGAELVVIRRSRLGAGPLGQLPPRFGTSPGAPAPIDPPPMGGGRHPPPNPPTLPQPWTPRQIR